MAHLKKGNPSKGGVSAAWHKQQYDIVCLEMEKPIKWHLLGKKQQIGYLMLLNHENTWKSGIKAMKNGNLNQPEWESHQEMG